MDGCEVELNLRHVLHYPIRGHRALAFSLPQPQLLVPPPLVIFPHSNPTTSATKERRGGEEEEGKGGAGGGEKTELPMSWMPTQGSRREAWSPPVGADRGVTP
jgi:hypothetical protein